MARENYPDLGKSSCSYFVKYLRLLREVSPQRASAGTNHVAARKALQKRLLPVVADGQASTSGQARRTRSGYSTIEDMSPRACSSISGRINSV